MHMGRYKNVFQKWYLNLMDTVCAVLISRLFRWKMVKWTCSFNARRIDTWKEQTRSWSSSDCMAQCWRHSLLPWGDNSIIENLPLFHNFQGFLHFVLQKQRYFKYEKTILIPPVQGYAAGNAVPSPQKNVERAFLSKYWSRWQADHTGRRYALLIND